MDRVEKLRCPRCGEVKRIEAFPRAILNQKRYRVAQGSWGRMYFINECKACKIKFLRTNTPKMAARQQRRGRINRFLAWKEATSVEA